jgi:hypothetical protein
MRMRGLCGNSTIEFASPSKGEKAPDYITAPHGAGIVVAARLVLWLWFMFLTAIIFSRKANGPQRQLGASLGLN